MIRRLIREVESGNRATINGLYKMFTPRAEPKNLKP